MTTYYAVTDCHGPISRRLHAAGDEEALGMLRRANSQAWIDEPAVDAEDDLGIAGDGMGPAEFAASLRSAGLEFVGEYDGWDLWRPMRCCPVCGDGVPLSGAPATAEWVPCCAECREYHERFGERADVMYATARQNQSTRTVIVTRHRGAVEWLQRHGINGEVRDHITESELAALPPCWVIGVLPLQLAVAAVQAGHRYISLQLDLSRAQRGQELSAEDMEGIATLLELQLQHRYLYGDSEWRHWPDGIADAHAGDLQAFRIGLANIAPAELKEAMERYQ